MLTFRNHSALRRAVHRLTGLAFAASLAINPNAYAQITNWQTGNVIPGTEAIAVEPQLILQNWNTIDHNLRFADLTGRDLHGSNFYQSWLDSARLNDANISNGFFGLSSLSNADLSHSNLSDSYFGEASLVAANLSSTDLSNAGMFENTNLTDANLTNANILGARFGAWFGGGSVAIGFTKEQLYSTASYQQKNLEEVAFDKLNLTSWDFSHQNLKRAQFEGATLQGASFRRCHHHERELY